MKKAIHFSRWPLRISVSDLKYKSDHYHPSTLELMFVLEGTLAVTCDRESVFVRAGEFIAINAGYLHSIHSHQICTIVSLYFDLDHYSQTLPFILGARFACAPSRLCAEQLPYWNELRNYFIRLMLMHNKNTPPAQTIMQQLADKIVLLLWFRFQRRKEMPEQTLERFYSISSYLQANFEQDISVADVAEHEKISVTRLAHFWKDTTGQSIRQTITKLRLMEAEKMLLETPLTVNEVAYRCGFSDEKYFYQHFKGYFKMTPNEYRIRHLENQQQTVRVLLSRRESEQQIAAFAMKYYVDGIRPSLPDLTQEELDKEAFLDQLYCAILCHTMTVIPLFSDTQQDVGYMQIAPCKALVLQNGQYQLNWEYIYAQMHIFLDYSLTTNIVIFFDCMDEEAWKPLLSSLVDELLTVWGKRVVESQNYIIRSSIVPNYPKCMALAEYLKQNTPVQKARAIYML